MKKIIEENENEPEDFCLAAEEHLKKKRKVARSRELQKRHRDRLYRELAESYKRYYKPSIWIGCRWDEESGDYVPSLRVMRGKNSRCQQTLKRISRRTIRNLGLEDLPKKGNGYRKVYDYWWKWL